MKGILKNLHRYLLWAILSVVFWAWVISLITNAPAGKKLVLYADLDAMDREALSAALEQDMPKNIQYVEPLLFVDTMFEPAGVTKGDLFIVTEGQAEGSSRTFPPSTGPPSRAKASMNPTARPTASSSTTRGRGSGSPPSTWPTSPGRPTTSSSTPNPATSPPGTTPPTTPPSGPPGPC